MAIGINHTRHHRHHQEHQNIDGDDDDDDDNDDIKSGKFPTYGRNAAILKTKPCRLTKHVRSKFRCASVIIIFTVISAFNTLSLKIDKKLNKKKLKLFILKIILNNKINVKQVV